MNILTTKTHGMLDYPAALLLILSPWAFGFAQEGPQTDIPVVLGMLMLFGNIVTGYEAGVIALISMQARLLFNVIFGLFLAVSPWLFGFSAVVFLPHVLIGAGITLLAMFTEKEPRVKSRCLNRQL